MASQSRSWFGDISAYFRFVGSRRENAAFSIFPSLLNTLSFTVLIVVSIGLIVLYADPVYLNWVHTTGRKSPEIFQYITKLGKVNWILIPSASALIVLSLFRADRFQGPAKIAWHRLFLNFWFAFTAVAYSGLIALGLKNLFGRTRPQFSPVDQVWVYRPFEFDYDFASFPSGHSTTGGAIAMVLILLFPRWRIVFVLLGIAIATSRPVLGVHFPSDVVAGLTLGVGFVWIYARVFAKKRLLFRFDPQGGLKLRGEKPGGGPLIAPFFKEVFSSQKDKA